MTAGLRAAIALAALSAAVLGAGFLAPYDPTTKHRDHPLAPPTPVHTVDHEGRVHLRPFGYGDADEHRRVYPLRFFQRSAAAAAGSGSSRHLFIVDPPGDIILAIEQLFWRGASGSGQ